MQDLTTHPLLRKALYHHEQGELAEAERLYREILSSEPLCLPAMLQLAAVCIQRGELTLAKQFCQQAVEEHRDSADAHAHLGIALNVLGQPSEAGARFERAISLDASFPEAHYGLGAALQSLNRLEEAIACYRRALSLDADYAEANCALALALQALGRHRESVDCCRAALDVDPEYGDAHYALGIAQSALKKHEEAVSHYRAAVNCGYNHFEVELALGHSFQELGQYAEAVESFNRSICLKPADARPRIALGETLNELGRQEEARACFEAAVAAEPNHARAHLSLARSRCVSDSDPQWLALKELYRDIDTRSTDDRMAIHLAMAKALDDVGEHEWAFRHLLKGNALKRQSLTYDEPAALDLFRQISSTFTPSLLATWRGAGHDSDLPVFILGMPRSGSTLVEQILASHPHVVAAGERLDFRQSATMAGVEGEGNPFPRGINNLTADQLKLLGETYIRRLCSALPKGRAALRITDKMPANFHFVGLIYLALPNARIIHTKRDPVDTCLSCFSVLSSSDQPFVHDLAELGRYYRGYQGLMEHWQQILPLGSILNVQYEDLVGSFETSARRIVKFCGLEWSSSCLSFFDNKRPVRTASMAQVRTPIYQSSVGRWRPSGEVLRPLLEALTSGD